MNALNNTTINTCFSRLTDNETTPLALATVILALSPTSGKVGDKALVSAEDIVEGWIGGGCVRHAVIEATAKVLASGTPNTIRVAPKGEWAAMSGITDFASGCLSGGTLVIFIEPLFSPPTLTVLGRSAVAQSLAYQAMHLSFSVTLASPKLSAQQLENTAMHYHNDFSNIEGDFLVIATQGENDRAAMMATLNTNAHYITMVASTKKITGLKAILEKSGVDTKTLDRIHSPAGIDIGAVTPAEIALSILSDIVRVYRSAEYKKRQPVLRKNAIQEDKPSGTEKGCCGG